MTYLDHYLLQLFLLLLFARVHLHHFLLRLILEFLFSIIGGRRKKIATWRAAIAGNRDWKFVRRLLLTWVLVDLDFRGRILWRSLGRKCSSLTLFVGFHRDALPGKLMASKEFHYEFPVPRKLGLLERHLGCIGTYLRALSLRFPSRPTKQNYGTILDDLPWMLSGSIWVRPAIQSTRN